MLQAGTQQAKIQSSDQFIKGYKQLKATENRDLRWDVSDSICGMLLTVKTINKVQKCVSSSKRIGADALDSEQTDFFLHKFAQIS